MLIPPIKGNLPRLPIRHLGDCGVSERGEIHVDLRATDARRNIHLVHPVLRDVVVELNGRDTLNRLEALCTERILWGN